MKYENWKKIMLYISLFPYIYLILSSLYYSIFGHTYDFEGAKTIYGIEAFIDNIVSGFWFKNFITFNIIGLLCICCIIYQIWYFIKRKDSKIKDKTKLTSKKVFFVISLFTWIIYFSLGIHALFFGYEIGWFTKTTVYGFKAFREAMFWNLIKFTFIPILPISLIYIVVYLISNKNTLVHSTRK